MPGSKHLILIHGRSTKPSESEKRSLVNRVITDSLNRIDSNIAKNFSDNKIKYSFIYYGDINNKLMLEHDKSLKNNLISKNDAKYNFEPCEPVERYASSMDQLLTQSSFTKEAYQELLRNHRDQRFFDDIARAVSWAASLTGFSDNIIRWTTADMGAYLMTRKAGSAIRQRLQEPLRQSLLDGDDICLVSHSMGCIVSYDVLWKFSQMSEYSDIQHTNNKVNLWLTLGNPLGEPGVKQNLYDAHEGKDGKYPRDIIKNWVNIAAHDDFVAHDSRIADDYEEMRELNYIENITDLPEIYTFWVGKGGVNPHKLYGYLHHPTVAQQIIDWVKS